MSKFLAQIKKELQNIKTRHKAKYGAAIFDVKIKSIGGIIVLNGIVLSEKQKNEACMAVKDIVKDAKIDNEIKVLSDPEDELEIGWGLIAADVADIFAKLSDGKKIMGISLASQALKGDPVRILGKKEKWRLLQTGDLAIGWADFSRIEIGKRKIIKKEWIKAKMVKRGQTVKKRLAKNIQSKFIRFIEKYLNAPYLLGGMTDKGIDCSGLAEKFYSDVFGVFLPRHSADQALCGEKIELFRAHFGDLVFLRNKDTKLAHIGVIVEKFETSNVKRRISENILVLNSRFENKKASIEDLAEILKKYNLIFIKRIIRES